MTEKPYTGHVCTRHHHRLKADRQIKPKDTSVHACSCGATLIGNGHVIVRLNVIHERFPEGAVT